MGGFLVCRLTTFDRMNKAFFVRLLAVLNLSLFGVFARAQENISIATGASVLRNFSPQQSFWAAGHTVQAHVHFTAKQSAYAWLEYYTDGKFTNTFTATAKSALTTPQQLRFSANGRLTYRHFSIGWKHYFSGNYANTKSFSMYGLAGFGLLFAKVQNEVSTPVNLSLYDAPTIEGQGNVRKLTVDMGAGGELPLSASIFGFADVRTWLPSSSNESPYLHNQRNVPLPFMLSAGVRVLLGSVR
ncbi:MAG TPA: hypothetical protein VM871_06010 [Flavisolibacter sp.]|nr:hypothetical protein [Flavisolibacter sp.]